jgi:DNA-binding NarL/FixJ family response regulator
MIKIIVAEDQALIRTGIKGLLDAEKDIEVVGLACNGVQVMKILEEGTFADLIISDISMPEMDGLTLLKNIKDKYPKIRLLLLSMSDNEKHIFDAFENGAIGYVLKNATIEELVFCIRQAALGQPVICNEIGIRLLKQAANRRLVEYTDLELSEKEIQILELISRGYTNQEIADTVFASRRTVEGHRQALVIKTGVKNTAELIRFACKHGII